AQRDAMEAELRELTAPSDGSLMPDADLAAKAMQRQREMAEAAAELVQSEDSAIGQITAGVFRLCASAFPKAVGAKLVIETDPKNDRDHVDIHLPVCRSVTAATDTHNPQQSPRQTRARLRAWWARILEEVHAVETELEDSDSPLAKSLAPRVAHDLSLKLGQVWHMMATTMLLESPTEFPEITPG
ncbi:MAG: hypothetical protein C0467_26815, partial [Planctomycetaceae bacterium]|nr:hypothetical protein [Planctomycetaceae bacterium]